MTFGTDSDGLLAVNLNNTSNYLERMGLREDSLKTIQEAVALGRVLVQHDFQRFTSSLVSSLNNLSNILSSLGQKEAALEVVREAVLLQRELLTTA